MLNVVLNHFTVTFRRLFLFVHCGYSLAHESNIDFCLAKSITYFKAQLYSVIHIYSFTTCMLFDKPLF